MRVADQRDGKIAEVRDGFEQYGERCDVYSYAFFLLELADVRRVHEQYARDLGFLLPVGDEHPEGLADQLKEAIAAQEKAAAEAKQREQQPTQQQQAAQQQMRCFFRNMDVRPSGGRFLVAVVFYARARLAPVCFDAPACQCPCLPRRSMSRPRRC